MKKVIVTTTINPPTEAIRKFDSMPDWHLIVAGDRKTPEYRLERGTYLSPEDQEKYDPLLSEAIGWNSIQRRNFAFLAAHDMHADIIALVDDDNIPFEGWGQNLLIGREVEVNYYETDLDAFDPVGATNHPHLWHRGYPIQLIPRRDYYHRTRRTVTPDVQADFWNGDPDVDAICRLEHAPECKFDDSFFPMAANKPGPFNSQNTFLAGHCLKDYMVFPHVGRMDDIWPSYYFQARGYQVIWNKASVYQARNEHDLVRDMQQEYIGYENNLNLVRSVARDPESITRFIPGRTAWAFSLYRRHFEKGS
ncbi:hypothetical protein [Occallatibacter savannae]|uniref:hypothetical protein n=1 Tax=Occallatibacter savannae TaxID=1002691 RepID=UPI000D69D31D|nr:hypothetical protein [Occallatibacter savannae]